MSLSITSVPLWVSISFMVAFGTPIILIIHSINKTQEKYSKHDQRIAGTLVVLFYILFFSAISVASLMGIFEVNTIPPRILVFAALPLFLFYWYLYLAKKWFRSYFQWVDWRTLTSIHVFRFVGIYFLINHSYGSLPTSFAYIGGLGDILTALLAVLYVFVVSNHSLKLQRAYLIVFNCVGLLDIISVLITAFLLTKESVVGGTVGVSQFGTFPFSWIPAFAPATIVFLHIMAFLKLFKPGIDDTLTI